jgi:hypothetical protein
MRGRVGIHLPLKGGESAPDLIGGRLAEGDRVGVFFRYPWRAFSRNRRAPPRPAPAPHPVAQRAGRDAVLGADVADRLVGVLIGVANLRPGFGRQVWCHGGPLLRSITGPTPFDPANARGPGKCFGLRKTGSIQSKIVVAKHTSHPLSRMLASPPPFTTGRRSPAQVGRSRLCRETAPLLPDQRYAVKEYLPNRCPPHGHVMSELALAQPVFHRALPGHDHRKEVPTAWL